MKILLTQMASYHLWANQLMTDRILALPEEVCTQQVPSSFPTLAATLQHLWDAESIWWQRMKLLEQIVVPSQGFSGATADIVKGLLQQSKQWQEWVHNAQEHMFEHEFIYYNSRKEKFKQGVYQVLMHLFNHGTYHRGQLVTMMRELAVNNIPQTDFIVWSRKK